ncbi:MAG: nickel ABC transporter, nickel/metallophore periplasmic binding protein, partial [Synergistaceae bacterium]|nr:nickel ABC transporter, nickel/metallophore periplasmic binding protein [Synergistaceae bacterium]
MNRLKLFLFAALLTFALSSAASAEEGGTLVYSWSSNAGPLNPHMYSPNQMFAQAMVYEPLVSYGDDGELKPCLAESWEISPDGREYTFHLRKGVVFSDGEPWNAAAAKKNLDDIMANAPRHAWIGLTNHLEAAEASEEHTLVLKLNSPYYPALHDLSAIRPFRFLSPAAFPDEGITRDGIKAPVGTGPWVHADSSRGEFDLFVRNDRYWGGKPHFEKILVKVITDADARMLALETGEIDLIFGAAGSSVAQVSMEGFMRMKQTGRFEADISGPVTTYALALNSGRGPTADRAVRRALQHLVDKDLLIKAVFMDMERKADFFFEPSIPYCDVGLEAYDYDVAKAEALLDKAGWKRQEG